MISTGYVVCVNYATTLRECLLSFFKVCRSIVVVTTPDDALTRCVLKSLEVEENRLLVLFTDVFTKNGAYFNKGAALEQAYNAYKDGDWCLFFDADITLDDLAVHSLRELPSHATIDKMYGVQRRNSGETKILNDPWPAGWCMAFHPKGPALSSKPPIPNNFIHAGNYDSVMIEAYPPLNRIFLPGVCEHYGPSGVNWCGIDNRLQMKEIRRQRRKGKSWKDETIWTPGES